MNVLSFRGIAVAKSAAILCSALIVMTGCQANQHSRCTLSHCYAAPVLCEEQAAYESEAFSESGSIEDFVEMALSESANSRGSI